MLYLLKTLLPILFVIAITAASAVFLRHLRNWKSVTPYWVTFGALPSLWFVGERIIYYILYNITGLLNPDIPFRKIAREPHMQHTIWYGLAAIIIICLIASLRSNRKSEAA